MASHISAYNKNVLDSKIEAEVKTCKHFAYPCPLQNNAMKEGPLVYQVDEYKPHYQNISWSGRIKFQEKVWKP